MSCMESTCFIHSSVWCTLHHISIARNSSRTRVLKICVGSYPRHHRIHTKQHHDTEEPRWFRITRMGGSLGPLSTTSEVLFPTLPSKKLSKINCVFCTNCVKLTRACVLTITSTTVKINCSSGKQNMTLTRVIKMFAV